VEQFSLEFFNSLAEFLMKNGRKTLLGLGEHRENIGLENRKNIKYRKFAYCSS
jgi:hypothetical protein